MTLKEKREAAGFTQKEAASALEVTITTVSRWENGKVIPHKSHVNAMETLYKTGGPGK